MCFDQSHGSRATGTGATSIVTYAVRDGRYHSKCSWRKTRRKVALDPTYLQDLAGLNATLPRKWSNGKWRCL